MTATVLDREQTKDLLRQVLVELLHEQRSEFQELVAEALEDVALANAIQEGRKNQFVGEDEIQAVLKV